MPEIKLSLEYQKPKLIWRILGIFLGIILFTFSIFTIIAYRKTKKFTAAFASGAGLSEETVLETANQAVNQFRNLLSSENREVIKQSNFLILGTDELTGREGSPVLTDTILLLQLDLANSKIKTLALPRDLYNSDYQTRINALYHYGTKRDSNNPEAFPANVIGEMTDLEIEHSLVLGIEDLETLIEIVGEIEIDVPAGFTDTEFPRPGVDVSTETNPAILYERISFESGMQNMDAATALKYMRSRHSNDDEGTDLARSQRQQLVIESLFKQLSNISFLIENPEKLGQIYRFYLDHFAKNLAMEKIVDLAYAAYTQVENLNSFQFASHSLSVYPENKEGVIYNPPLWQSNGQWIYQIRDQAQFKNEIQSFFNVN